MLPNNRLIWATSEGKVRWCGNAGHGPEGKEDLRNKQCEEEGCKTQAGFGMQDEGKASWYAKAGHRPEGKQDLKNKRCEEEGCETSACFGLPDEGKIWWWEGRAQARGE